MQTTADMPRKSRPDGRSPWQDLARGEEGAAFLEFLIVLYAWMALLFGVIQFGLIAISAFYVNYANFMALRTAAVQYEYYEAGWMSESAFRTQCERAAAKALAPQERFYWKKTASFSGYQTAFNQIMARTRFDYTTSGSLPDGKPAYIHGRLTYRFHMIAPFVNLVINAFANNPYVQPIDDRRVMQNFVSERPASGMLPTLRMQSRNDLRSDGGPIYYHDMVIQRRWRYK